MTTVAPNSSATLLVQEDGYVVVNTYGALASVIVTPNGSAAPNFTDTSSSKVQYREAQRIKAACADHGTLFIGFSGIPMLAVAPDNTSASEDYNAPDVVRLNAFMAAILVSNDPVIDCYTPMSGPPDADGQVTMLLGTSADGIHPNTNGHTIMAPPAIRGIVQRVLI